MNALEKLKQILETKYPDYTTDDVILSRAKGYLVCKKECPKRGTNWYCGSDSHWHSISIYGEGYPKRNEKGRYISPYRLWNELHFFLKKGEVDFLTGKVRLDD